MQFHDPHVRFPDFQGQHPDFRVAVGARRTVWRQWRDLHAPYVTRLLKGRGSGDLPLRGCLDDAARASLPSLA